MSVRQRIFFMTGIPILTLVLLSLYSNATVHGLRDGSFDLIQNEYMGQIKKMIDELLDGKIYPFLEQDIEVMVEKELPAQKALIWAGQSLLNADRDAYQARESLLMAVLQPQEFEKHAAFCEENLDQVYEGVHAAKASMGQEELDILVHLEAFYADWKKKQSRYPLLDAKWKHSGGLPSCSWARSD